MNLACRQRAGEINTRPSNPTQRCRPMQRKPSCGEFSDPATKPTGGQSFSGRRAVAAPRGESQRHTADVGTARLDGPSHLTGPFRAPASATGP